MNAVNWTNMARARSTQSLIQIRTVGNVDSDRIAIVADEINSLASIYLGYLGVGIDRDRCL